MGTQKIRVANTTFLVDRLGMDCGPLQYVRELTQNAIEAIEKRRQAGWDAHGRIIWDVDWPLAQTHNLWKLQVSDNGSGMTGDEIEQYINSLSSSGGTQGFTENFGVGAKIAAGKENPEGLIYRSWVNDTGVMAHFWRDPQDGYGLAQMQVGGEYRHIAPISGDLKTTPIDTHGTSVTLMGATRDENTYAKHDLKQKWLIEYLNSRYYVLPENLTIQVRDFSRADPADWPESPDVPMKGGGGSQLRTVRGMRELLVANAVSFGTVELKTARAHWYLMPENLNVSGGVWNEKSHVAALFQNELYDIRNNRQSFSELREFGILYGQQRVVLYLEPDTEKLKVVANTARSSLLLDQDSSGAVLPWEDWKAEFRDRLPQEIRDMMNEILSRTNIGDYNEEVRRRLREIRDLFRFERYRRSKTGTVPTGGELPGGSRRELDGTGSRPGTGGGRRSGGGAGDLFGAFIAPEGDPSSPSPSADNYPKAEWVSVNDGTRSPEDDLEDRAARYVRSQNLIQINADFRGFEKLTDVLATEYPQADASDIQRAFREWTALQLAEAVYAVLHLQGSPEWDSNQIHDVALSPEALTTAVLSRYTTLSHMRRQLGSRLGRTSTSA